MCKHGTSVVLSTPPWLWTERVAPENGIAIDACIADVVLALWGQGVITLGSCCGHGTERPSLVLNADLGMPDLARLALDEIDPVRDWELMQWQLVTVADERRGTFCEEHTANLCGNPTDDGQGRPVSCTNPRPCPDHPLQGRCRHD